MSGHDRRMRIQEVDAHSSGGGQPKLAEPICHCTVSFNLRGVGGFWRSMSPPTRRAPIALRRTIRVGPFAHAALARHGAFPCTDVVVPPFSHMGEPRSESPCLSTPTPESLTSST
jgi:hypothetical protein